MITNSAQCLLFNSNPPHLIDHIMFAELFSEHLRVRRTVFIPVRSLTCEVFLKWAHTLMDLHYAKVELELLNQWGWEWKLSERRDRGNSEILKLQLLHVGLALSFTFTYMKIYLLIIIFSYSFHFKNIHNFQRRFSFMPLEKIWSRLILIRSARISLLT